MFDRKTLFIIFIVVALVQLYFPARMVFASENVLETGKEFRFRTAPLDPVDPFRGRYITLRFAENQVRIPFNDNWTRGEIVYVSLSTDSLGFAKISAISKKKPANNVDYLTANVDYRTMEVSNSILFVDYPFDRFYMEESKAPAAEKVYNRAQLDSTSITYALVNIKEGAAVLKDVVIDGVSINKIVAREQENK